MERDYAQAVARLEAAGSTGDPRGYLRRELEAWAFPEEPFLQGYRHTLAALDAEHRLVEAAAASPAALRRELEQTELRGRSLQDLAAFGPWWEKLRSLEEAVGTARARLSSVLAAFDLAGLNREVDAWALGEDDSTFRVAADLRARLRSERIPPLDEVAAHPGRLRAMLEEWSGATGSAEPTGACEFVSEFKNPR